MKKILNTKCLNGEAAEDHGIAKDMCDLIENQKIVVKEENMCDVAFATDEKLKQVRNVSVLSLDFLHWCIHTLIFFYVTRHACRKFQNIPDK